MSRRVESTYKNDAVPAELVWTLSVRN